MNDRDRGKVRFWWRRFMLSLFFMGGAWSRAVGLAAEESPDDDDRPLNLETTTLGGKQVWTDELIVHGWRIQRQALSGHYRLLDDRQRRKAWGSFEACQAVFDECWRNENIPPVGEKVVIVLHGMFRTRSSMATLANRLKESGYTVLSFGYSSTREGVEDHARALAKVIGHLDRYAGPEGVNEIHLVAHSLGNLVIRRYLHSDQGQDAQPAIVDSRIGRVVMLAPPNQQPQRAKFWSQSSIWGRAYSVVAGKAGHDLAAGWEDLNHSLAVPKVEFAIIAGGKGDGRGWHWGIPGDDDGTVSVDETRLPGAADFAVVPVSHTFIMNDSRVLEMTVNFLREGYLVSKDARQPIPRDDNEDAPAREQPPAEPHQDASSLPKAD